MAVVSRVDGAAAARGVESGKEPEREVSVCLCVCVCVCVYVYVYALLCVKERYIERG